MTPVYISIVSNTRNMLFDTVGLLAPSCRRYYATMSYFFTPKMSSPVKLSLALLS